MLLLFLFSFFLASNVVSQITLSQKSLVFAPGWKSATATASGNFLFTDTLGQALTVTLPLSTSSLNYIGLKRTGGSIYGVCMDCPSGTTTNLQLFSAHDNTLLNNADAKPITIFSLDMDPTQEHTLQILNLADSRFGNESELTFISIVVQQSSSTVTSSTSTSTSSVSSSASSSVTTTSTSPSASVVDPSVTSSISHSSASATPSASASSAPALGSSRNQTRNSLIAIVTIISIIILSSLAIGIFLYRRSRQSPVFEDLTRIEDPPSLKQLEIVVPSTLPSSGFLAMAGRQKPPRRLPEPYPYDSDVPRNGPILPVRRVDSG